GASCAAAPAGAAGPAGGRRRLVGEQHGHRVQRGIDGGEPVEHRARGLATRNPACADGGSQLDGVPAPQIGFHRVLPRGAPGILHPRCDMFRTREEPMTFRRLVAVSAALAALAGVAPVRAETTVRVVLHSDLKIIDQIWTTAYSVRNHGYMTYDTPFPLAATG